MGQNASKILKIFRVKEWIHYLGYTLIGSFLSQNFNILNFVVTPLLLSYAYSLNDYYDKKLRKKYFFIPLVLFLIFLPLLPTFSAIVSIFFVILFTLYSWPKSYLEGKPFISTLSNSIGFTLLLILPFWGLKEFFINLYFILLIFLMNNAAQFLHEIVDYKKDKKINKITTTVKFGIKKSLTLFKLCLLAAILTSFSLLEKFSLIPLSTILFSLLFLRIKKANKKVRKKFKELGIFIGIVYLFELL